MTETTLQQKLITVLRQERQTERDLVAALSDDARNATGAIDRWAVKNIITHMASAKYGLAGDLAAGRHGQDVTPFNHEYQAFNDRTFTQHQHTSWNEVNAYADAGVETLILEIERYDDPQLRQPNIQAWMDEGATIAAYVFGLAVAHSYKHITQLYAENGHPDTAYALLESLIPFHHSLGAPPEEVAGSHYDLAATYAKLGQSDRAIAHLQDACLNDPAFKEWAKEDPAFNALRENADFQALYA